MDGVDAKIEGPRAGKPVVMVHGWPDSHRLWDAQVAALRDRYLCVRFTLPGFDAAGAKRAYSLDEIVQAIASVIERSCEGRRATLLLHDWGCVFGYQLALRRPELVERVIGVDVGDAGSRHHMAEIGPRPKLMILAYQYWLAWAWRLGGRTGDAMARWMARRLRCPVKPENIHASMGYPYAMRWLGVAGGLRQAKTFHPSTPMLFIYGESKPFMFHSRVWAEHLAARPASRVVSLPTGHWVMLGKREEFNQAVLAWLRQTDD